MDHQTLTVRMEATKLVNYLDVSPPLPKDNGRNTTLTNAIHQRQFGLGNPSVFILFPYFFYCGLIEFRGWVFTARSLLLKLERSFKKSISARVHRVLFGRPKVQVHGVNAQFVVTAVQYVQSVWDSSILKLVRSSMRRYLFCGIVGFASDAYLAIATRIGACCPPPAALCFFYFAPKSFVKRSRFWSGFHFDEISLMGIVVNGGY